MVDKSEKFNWLVRLGYFSRAILYIMLGYIALTSASALSEGMDGIFRAIEDVPLGVFILWVMVIGLAFYGLFRLCSLLFDIENNGSDAKGWAKRIGHAGSAIGHFILAWTAYQLANGSGGRQATDGGVLSADFGGIVIGIFGIIFFIVALHQFKKGISGEFMSRISSSAPNATRALGGVGYCARGVVYGIIGWSLFRAGFLSQDGAGDVRSLSDALATLSGQGWVFIVTAIGLLLFGVFSLILARYRIVPELDKSDSAPDFRT